MGIVHLLSTFSSFLGVRQRGAQPIGRTRAYDRCGGVPLFWPTIVVLTDGASRLRNDPTKTKIAVDLELLGLILLESHSC